MKVSVVHGKVGCLRMSGGSLLIGLFFLQRVSAAVLRLAPGR